MNIEEEEISINVIVFCVINFPDLLWTAPELLRQPFRPERGSQKGDVYSFAIVCHEIVTRQGPFYLGFGFSDDFGPKEIVERVARGGTPPFRPAIDDCTIDDIRMLMENCWDECPCERPDFRSLKSSIRRINKLVGLGMQNVVEN